QDLGALLLATREPVVDVPGAEALVDLELLHLGAQPVEELASRHLLPLGPERSAQEVHRAHTRDRGRILKAEKQAEPRASVRGEREQILAAERRGTAGDDVLGMTHERVREGALARTVRAHQRMDLSLRHLEV